LKELKKIISFCLWGTDPKYTIGAIKNAELAKTIYPGWICRYYVGNSTVSKAADIVKQLESYKHVEVIRMSEEGDWNGMFWRFYPISENDVEVMISRDTDSRLSFREKYAVSEWLSSDKKFHIMRDHPYHTFKILGGMWGAKKGILSNMKELIDSFNKGDYWQIDQDFLSEVVYPKIAKEVLVHDEFTNAGKFPKKRNDLEFVGSIYDEFDNQDNELKIILKEHLDYHKIDHRPINFKRFFRFKF
jgi:hypothetical protein